MSVVSEIGEAARALAERVDHAVVAIGTDRRGSGVVIGEGKVVTNAHNLRDRSTAVTFADGRSVQGRVSGADVDGDLVVLDVDTGGVAPVAVLAGSPSPGLGDLVYAAGRAEQGLRLTVGFVSGVERSFRGPRGRRIAGSIEHSAPLARGSSGGPLFSGDGALVGINTHRAGGGFYLARATDEALAARLGAMQAGRSFRPRRLGVALAPPEVANRLRRAVGLPERDGLLVRSIEDGSPAAAAGLAVGDLLVGAAGSPLAGIDDLHRALSALEGDELELAVVRATEEVAVTVRFDASAGAGSTGAAATAATGPETAAGGGGDGDAAGGATA